MTSLDLDDLRSVTGGGHSLCQPAAGSWRPTPPNTTLDSLAGFPQKFANKASCVAAVEQWKGSLIRAD